MKTIRYLVMVCLIAVFICWNGISVSATEMEIDTSVFEYRENSDGTIYISDYNGTDETVIVPSEIDGKNVTSIGDRAFAGCINIKSVILSDNLVKIGDFAFNDCCSLKTIVLPDSLVSIGQYSFKSCNKLSDINLPDNLSNIGHGAFYDCIKLSKISIPRSVKNIQNVVFFNCSNLQEVEINDGVSEIGLHVFFGCNLKKIIIPNSVNYINEKAFVVEYESINAILPKDLIIYAESNSYARTYANKMGIKFSCLNTHDWDNGVITVEPTIKNKGELTYTCTACGVKRIETLPIVIAPKKGKTISAFNSQDIYKVTKSGTKNGTVEFLEINNSNTTNISIPNTITVSGITYKVTSISKNAFKNNKKLERVTIGKNITSINANAFKGCSNLKEIQIKSRNLKSIGKNAFKGINPKAKIKIPAGSMEKYKKLLTKKGQKSTVIITK